MTPFPPPKDENVRIHPIHFHPSNLQMRFPWQFGILDLTGLLEVTDPPLFLSHLAAGFGRAMAFGCGLMLIRRAQ